MMRVHPAKVTVSAGKESPSPTISRFCTSVPILISARSALAPSGAAPPAAAAGVSLAAGDETDTVSFWPRAEDAHRAPAANTTNFFMTLVSFLETALRGEPAEGQ